MKVLITGSTGFIGTSLCKYLNTIDVNLVALVRQSSLIKARSLLGENVKIIAVNDITKPLDEAELSENDLVIHLATYYSKTHHVSEILPIINTNILLGTYLAHAVSKIGCKLINIGTNHQYINSSKYSPGSLYAASKQAMQDILEFYIKSESLKCVTFELCDTFGPFDYRDKIIPKFFESIKNHNTVYIDNPNNEINLIYIKDFLDLINNFIKKPKSEFISTVYTLSSNNFIKISELVSIFEKTLELKLSIVYKNTEEIKSMRSISPNPSPPNFTPTWSIEKGLKDIKNLMYS